MSILNSVATLLVLCFTLSLFWCGDAACLDGGSDEACAALVCSLQSKHDSDGTSSLDGNSSDCSCVCHVPTVAGQLVSLHLNPSFEQSSVTQYLAILSIPRQQLYRPPITA